ncbi:MAG: hypothetical protein ACYTHJ_03015 [Planctomycetota bacterium]
MGKKPKKKPSYLHRSELFAPEPHADASAGLLALHGQYQQAMQVNRRMFLLLLAGLLLLDLVLVAGTVVVIPRLDSAGCMPLILRLTMAGALIIVAGIFLLWTRHLEIDFQVLANRHRNAAAQLSQRLDIALPREREGIIRPPWHSWDQTFAGLLCVLVTVLAIFITAVTG